MTDAWGHAQTLYRCYDEDGSLIYLGASRGLASRLSHHRTYTWWWPQVRKIRVELAPGDEITLRAQERDAIRSERPRYNLQHRPSRDTWSQQEYLDAMRAHIEGCPQSAWNRRTVAMLRVEMDEKFGTAA